MAIFAAQSTWNNIFINYVNGVSKINLQLIIAIIAGIANIPLAILFAKQLSLGVNGVILSTICCLAASSIIIPHQYRLLISGKAQGIWAK